MRYQHAAGPSASRSARHAHVFVPQIAIRGDELAHHLNAAVIVENRENGAVLAERGFIALEG